MDIYMFVNRADLHVELVDKLKSAITKISTENNIDVKITDYDIGLYGESEVVAPSFVFGSFAKSQLIIKDESIPIFYLPDLDRLENKPGNKQIRKETADKMIESIKSLVRNKVSEKIEPIQESYAIEQDNTSIGLGNVDIVIPEDKVEYLARIKSLLNCNKIVIQKGDLRIEFD